MKKKTDRQIIRAKINALKKKYEAIEEEQQEYARYEQLEYELCNIQDEIEELEDSIDKRKK